MRRFVSLVVLLFFTVPFGASIVGCGNKVVTQFCSGGDSGPVVGQAKSITLSPNFAAFGESVNFGQMGGPLSASAVDCKGNAVSISRYTFATSDMSFADINPSSGVVCGGTFNRNSGGGIPDYTTCTAPATSSTTVTANIIEDVVPSASITSVSVTSNVVTLTAQNPFVPGQQVVLSGLTAASFLNGQTLSVGSVTGTTFTVNFATPNLPSTPVMGTAKATNVISFSATNTFVPGQQVTFSGLGQASFINGQTLPIVSATASSFTVNYAVPPSFITIADAGMATSKDLIALVTATADGATSNAIEVFIHPTVTSITIGNPTTNCSTDPDTSCCPVTTGAVVTAPAYTGNSCLSQGVSAQLTARAYKNGTTNPADNVTCQIGHLQYSAQNLSVLNIDQNGVATAAQPGSTIVTATISTSGSGGAAGFFSTCPPASIELTAAGQSSNNVTVNVNTSQPLTAVVRDTNNVVLTGVPLEFNSSSPTTIPAGASSVTPAFPGSATITAVCQPATCNSAPLSQLGLNGNGKPITSNGVEITAPGTSSTVLYIGSTQSQYILPVDFSTGNPGALVKLPYTPNSMVITNDGGTIYLGSGTALMSVSATSNQVGAVTLTSPGTVLSVAPNGSAVVVTDPLRQTVSLVAPGGSVLSTTGGIGTRAQWSPDSQTVYITGTNNQLLVHSDYTGWSTLPTTYQYLDVAVMVPSVGAFFATNSTITEARSYCPTTSLGSGNPQVATNAYYPVANSDTVAKTDRIAATNDGFHILGATATAPATLNDIALTIPNIPAGTANDPLDCTTATDPIQFGTMPKPYPLTGITATAITGVFPASNSALAFVTYTGASTGPNPVLPEYIPATGLVNYVTLSSGVAPVSGVFSSDGKTFFTGTSGDDQVHLITVNGTTATDTSVITPKLPDANGNTVAPDLLVQRPKKTTS